MGVVLVIQMVSYSHTFRVFDRYMYKGEIQWVLEDWENQCDDFIFQVKQVAPVKPLEWKYRPDTRSVAMFQEFHWLSFKTVNDDWKTKLRLAKSQLNCWLMVTCLSKLLWDLFEVSLRICFQLMVRKRIWRLLNAMSPRSLVNKWVHRDLSNLLWRKWNRWWRTDVRWFDDTGDVKWQEGWCGFCWVTWFFCKNSCFCRILSLWSSPIISRSRFLITCKSRQQTTQPVQSRISMLEKISHSSSWLLVRFEITKLQICESVKVKFNLHWSVLSCSLHFRKPPPPLPHTRCKISQSITLPDFENPLN